MTSEQEDQDYIDINQYWLILKRRWLPTSIVAASVLGLSAFVTFAQKPTYEAQGKLVLKDSNTSSLTGLNDKLGQLSGLTNTSNPLDTEAEKIRSNASIQKVIDKFNLQDKKGKPLTIQAVVANLKIKSVRGTDVMELSYRSKKPEEAAAVINFLMDSYLDSNISSNREEAVSAKDFLTKQLPQIENRVIQAEAELRQFKDKNRVVSLEEEARFGVEAVKDLQAELTRAEAALADKNTRSQVLQNELAMTRKEAVEFSTLSQSQGVQQVLGEYQKTQDELTVARTKLTEEHPTVRNLKEKESALRTHLEQRIGKVVGQGVAVRERDLQLGNLKQTLTGELVKAEADRLASAQQVVVLRDAYINYQRRLADIPKLEQSQRALERKLQVARSTYEQVLKQLQEVEVVEQQKVGNARIVSQALTPDKPISPKIPLNLALGGFLGLLLGAGTALLLEAMDKTLRDIDEAKRLLGLPLLGSIPQWGEKKGKKDKSATEGRAELPVLNNPYSPVSTAFEMLQTNLSFAVSDKELRVILVTSSCPGEGKSFVCANLAVSMSMLGKRVLLIDTDMRRPRQHKVWELPNFMGLSSVLTGQAQLSSVAQEALVSLDVLPVGTIPPNPVTLLESQRMANLVKEASSNYDCVIIDTPPLTAVADALVVGKLVDGMLLVVRPGEVESGAVQASKSMLEQAKVPVLGMIVNGVDSGNSYGGYYYTKGYYGMENLDKNGVVPPIRVG